MSGTTALCYVASAGHVFQTALSAIQARRHIPPRTQVFVVFLTGQPVEHGEADLFEEVLGRNGVTMLRLERSVLDGLPATFGRYYVDRVLPREVDRVLYLDGDTQITSDLAPLLGLTPPNDGVVASRDPMVLLHRVDPIQRRRIDRWWTRSGITGDAREGYLNSGVFLIGRSALPALARDIATHARTRPDLTFPDQDAFNIVMQGRVRIVSTGWNFPGFLLGTAAEKIAPPRVVHFMSNPRPWSACLRPWGRRFYTPYEQLVRDEPALAPYWQRFGALLVARYSVQQALKGVTERRVLAGRHAKSTMRELEALVDLPTGHLVVDERVEGGDNL